MTLRAAMFTAAALLAAPAACNKGASSYDGSQNVSSATVTASGQPETIFDPTTGAPTPNAVGQVNQLAKTAGLDFRADAPTGAIQPTGIKTIDPRTFAVSGTYTPGGGVPARAPLAGQIAVPSDGKQATHPVCPNPFPAPGNTSTKGLTVDGDLTDWPVGALVARGASTHMISDDLNLRELYFARDATNVVLGVKAAGAWVVPYPGTKQLGIQFTALNVPASAGAVFTTGPTMRYYVRGNELFDDNGKVPQGTTGAGVIAYDLAVKDQGIELSLPRTAIDPTLGSAFSVQVYTQDFTNNRVGRIGTHLVGLKDDYACLIPTALAGGTNDATLMAVFRRNAAVDPTHAEIGYRAFVAAVQATDYTLNDHLEALGTIPYTVMAFSGGYQVSLDYGLVVKDGVDDPLGDAGTPREFFRLSARLYGMLYSYFDYLLPTTWSREGFARWSSLGALETFYGPAVAQYETYAGAADVLAQQANHPKSSGYLDDKSWGGSPFSDEYYREKAGLYFALLYRLVDPAEFLAKILQVGRLGWPLYDTDDILGQIKDRHSYKGAATDDLKSGWISGTFDTSNLPLSLIGDQDADGLLAYQEAAFGSDPTAVDTGKDGTSDFAKLWLGQPPGSSPGMTALVADNYLGDWDLLAPTQLGTQLATSSATAPCGDSTLITRYGAVYDEGWLLIPVELKATPASSAGVVVYANIGTANGAQQTVGQTWGTSYVFGVGTPIAAARSPAPFVGNTLEMALNASFLGWSGGVMPAGTQITIATQATGSKGTCSQTPAIPPATSLP